MPDVGDQVAPPNTSPYGSRVVPTAGSQQEAVTEQLRGVDDALRDVAGLPVAEQVAVFTDLHQQLTAALAVTVAAGGPADEIQQHRPGGPGHRGR